MTSALVTGCAGFIGSRLSVELLSSGIRVVGVDCLTPYYDVAQKLENLSLLRHADFTFHQMDLAVGDLELLDDFDVVFHLAGQPGVRESWREQFSEYVTRNIVATQRLLELSVSRAVSRFVYASSSSIYGNAERYPVDELMRPAPFSPYGVTKLAAEHLCTLYAANFGLATVSLRYFTVYGPHQRPDMAAFRLCEAALRGTPFPLFGDGEQRRDFTYVDDVVRANILASTADVEPGFIANVAGGSDCTMNELIAIVEDATKRTVDVDRRATQRGDVARTGASSERAKDRLGWVPQIDLREGVRQQVSWHLARR